VIAAPLAQSGMPDWPSRVPLPAADVSTDTKLPITSSYAYILPTTGVLVGTYQLQLDAVDPSLGEARGRVKHTEWRSTER
jgi:hypothetical protein